ncbi:MAG TPA: hypothetical protein VF933_01815 [Streptosporangiaceae bacterium]
MNDLAKTQDGGIEQAALRSVPADWPYSPDTLGTPEIARVVDSLYAVRKAAGMTAAAVDAAIGCLAGELAANRPQLLTILFSPGALVTRVPELVRVPSSNPVNGWLGTCWLAEAAWRALNSRMTDPEFAAADRDLLLPLSARLRFLAIAEPMRHRGERASAWLPAGDMRDFDDSGLIGRVFGTGSWNSVVGRCRQARRIWHGYLDAYQSHPYLSNATPSELEAELTALVFTRSRGGTPMVLSVGPLSQPAAPTAEDTTLADEVTSRHLLPRFRLIHVGRLAAYALGSQGRVTRILFGACAVLAAGAAVAGAVSLHFHLAVGAAAGFYVVIGAGTVIFGRAWAAAWLLRMPAASTVGLLILLTLSPDWWTKPRVGWAAAVTLAAASYGYLVLEARNHGVGSGWAVGRSACVALVGAVHALLVSLIGLVAVAPAFVPAGNELARLWRDPHGYRHGGMVLLLATAWCLAAGGVLADLVGRPADHGAARPYDLAIGRKPMIWTTLTP